MAIYHELVHNLIFDVGLAPVVATDDTAQSTGIVDCLGIEGVTFVLMTGTLADTNATFAWTVQDGETSNLADAATADTACLVGSLTSAAFTFAADSVCKSLGYTPGKGAGKRYVRATVTPTGNTGAAPLAILVIKSPLQRPVAAL